MPVRALWVFLAIVGLLLGPTAWAVQVCAQAPMPDCCCVMEGPSGHHCCGIAPGKPNGGIPISPDRTAGNSPAVDVPAATLTEILRVRPEAEPPYRLATRFADAGHSPPLLALHCILLI